MVVPNQRDGGGGDWSGEIYYPFICFCFLLREREGDVFFFKRERPGAVRDRIRHWVMSGRYINVPVSLLLLLPTKSNYRYISVCSVFPLFYFLIFIYRSILSLDREKRKKLCFPHWTAPAAAGLRLGLPNLGSLSQFRERDLRVPTPTFGSCRFSLFLSPFFCLFEQEEEENKSKIKRRRKQKGGTKNRWLRLSFQTGGCNFSCLFFLPARKEKKSLLFSTCPSSLRLVSCS
jgi:hypothetical protein